MNTQMTTKGIVADATNAMVAAFDPKDLAPKSLIGVANGMNKTAMLFNNKAEASSYFSTMQQDDEVDVEISNHGYIVYLDASKSLDDDLTPEQRDCAQSMLSKASANALAIVNSVARMGWTEIHGHENDMWFNEPSKATGFEQRKASNEAKFKETSAKMEEAFNKRNVDLNDVNSLDDVKNFFR